MNPFIYATPSGYGFTLWSPGLVIVMGLIGLAACFPKDAANAAYGLVLMLQIELLNVKLYVAQRKMHRQLCKDAKAMGWPKPPFKFVRLQNRGRK